MSKKPHPGVPHDAGLVVADGRTAFILRNTGTAILPKFALVEELHNGHTAAAHEMGSDHPGRVHSSTGARRSAVEETDYHTQAEQRFAAHVAESVARLHGAGTFKTFVLVADPRTLAVLRSELPKPVQAAVVDEIAKDLTKHPLHEMERLLAG